VICQQKETDAVAQIAQIRDKSSAQTAIDEKPAVRAKSAQSPQINGR
jgi:hypothetical protein